ncbi:MFS transporter, partial [Streptomyces sp. MBT57]|nr:MFS transporter [Streptomyces sp. MBT57]
RVSGALTAGCEFAMPLGGLAAGLLVEGMGSSGALLAMGGVYFVATLSPLVFPAWRTMEKPAAEAVPAMAGRGDPVAGPGAPAQEVSVPPEVSSSAPSRPAPAP